MRLLKKKKKKKKKNHANYISFDRARTDQVYQRTHVESAMRRYLVENYLHHYMNIGLGDDVAKNAMLKRMKMKNGLSFSLDMFETIRKRKGKRRDPNKRESIGPL